MSTQYKVYSEISSEGLTDVIEKMLEDGWMLQGGVSTSQIHNSPVFAQAMTKIGFLDGIESERKRGRPKKIS